MSIDKKQCFVTFLKGKQNPHEINHQEISRATMQYYKFLRIALA